MHDGVAAAVTPADDAAERSPLEEARGREEMLNAATHAVGLALAVVGAAALLAAAVRGGDRWRLAGCAIYSVTLVATYAASTLSHFVRRPALRAAFRVADQALIFLFIAGSWTPVALAWLRGSPWWWAFHGTLWGVALVGFVSKALFSHRVELGTVSTVLYVVLGWSPAPVAPALYAAIPGPLGVWLLAGGAFYMAGLAFFHYDHRVPYFHAAWHVMVVAGSACHYLGILNYCAA